jgi:hypothetical protein
MPALFIIALIFLGAALVAGVISLFVKNRVAKNSYQEDFPFKTVARSVFGIALVLAIAFTGFSMMHTVSTQNVGIVKEFNKPTGKTTGAGFKSTAPWQDIDEWDASRQTFDHKNEKNCVQVRIVGLQSACVEVQIEYQTDKDKAPEQWASYKKDFEQFRARRVEPNLTGALNDIFATHDPLANVDPVTGVIKPVNTVLLVDPLKNDINGRIGSDIQVLGVVFGFVHYDPKTQEQIEAFQQKVLAHKNLEQDLKNAEVAKQITEKNAQVPSVTRCLEIVDRKGGEAGFCLGGGNPVTVTNK